MILEKLAEGYTYAEAGNAAGITKRAVFKRRAASAEFAAAVAVAREAGEKERTFRLWLRHPFRGKRPPTGRGHEGKPRFSYGRR